MVEICKSVLRTGFRGWFSYEPFDSGPNGEGREYDLDVYAVSARNCQKTLIEECAEA